MKTNLFMLLIVAFAPFSAVTQNMVLNPSAEADPASNGWTEASGFQWTRRATGNPPSYEGSYMFFAGPVGGEVELYQDIDVSAYATTIDNETQLFKFEDYVRSFSQSPVDQTKVIVEYRSAAGLVLSSFNSGYGSNTSAWLLVTDTRIAPATTRTIRIRLFSKRNSGTNNDGYHDAISLEPLAPLPVELVDFQAFAEGKKIKLSWQTASELDNDGFLVERTTNGHV